MANDPIFEENGEWYFWDEVWVEHYGPYKSEAMARAALELYTKYLDMQQV